MDRKRAGRLAFSAAQYGVAVAAIAWVLSRVELGRAVSLFARLGPGTVLAVLAVTVAGLLSRFFTWYSVMGAIEPVTYRAAGSVDLVVTFVNQLLPSRLTGRMAAPFVLRSRTGMAYPDAAAAAGVHTGMYAVVYGLASLVGLALAAVRVPPALVALLALSTGLYLAAGGVVLLAGTNLSVLDPLVGALAGGARRLPRVGTALAERIHGLTEFTSASTATFRSLAFDGTLWARFAAGWAGALVVAPGVRVWLLLSGFGVSFEPAVALPLYLVVAYSVTLLPLTPGGIGVTEASATAVFVALGVPGEVVVPVVFADRVLGAYLPALAGWYPSLHLDLSRLSTEE